MNEYELIRQIADRLPRAAGQVNDLFTADAEMIRFGDGVWAFTTDEFSAEEDGFTADDPAALGANLAVATLHDLFAVGAMPAFFLSALVLPRSLPSGFANGLAEGLAGILEACGCRHLGGDLGSGEDWRFTGTAFGPVSGDGYTRRFTADEAELWVSGSLGDANAALLTGAPTPRFELRLDLARVLIGHAVACIDTSGGLLDSLQMLARVNPAHRLEIDWSCVPLAASAAAVAQRMVLPPGAALVAGAGEYELVFAVRPGDPLRSELAGLGAQPIGTCRRSEQPGLWIVGRPAPDCPDPRGFASRSDYMKAVVQTALRVED
jgi:thiamine-monophosphate kinase